MRPQRGRAPEPDDGRADRSVRSPKFAWVVIALAAVLLFIGAAVLFAKG